MNKKLHYEVWKRFNSKVYKDSLSINNMENDGRIHHQEGLFKIDGEGFNMEYTPESPEDTYYVKMVKGNDFYLLPKRFINKLPVVPKSYIPVHLKKSDSQVWKFIKEVDSLSIPSRQTMTHRELVARFNPIENSEPRSSILLTLIALAEGLKLGICGDYGLGKNANLIIASQMLNNVSAKVKHPTAAKFYRTLYYNNYINLDELTSWKGTEVQIVEDMMAAFGDESPDMEKYSTDKNRLLENLDNINNKSLTFTFNPYSRKNPIHLADKFKNFGKIQDRYPILYLKGKIIGTIERPDIKQSRKIMEENFPYMCDIASAVVYYRENVRKHLHNYSKSKLKFYGSRHPNNIQPLINHIDLMSDNQEEFDNWMEYLNECRDRYTKETMVDISEEGPQSTLKVSEEVI